MMIYLNLINKSQSLFCWKLLCNCKKIDEIEIALKVTILILLETSLQYDHISWYKIPRPVTILILLETSLQYDEPGPLKIHEEGHNPYFAGNFFAME